MFSSDHSNERLIKQLYNHRFGLGQLSVLTQFGRSTIIFFDAFYTKPNAFQVLNRGGERIFASCFPALEHRIKYFLPFPFLPTLHYNFRPPFTQLHNITREPQNTSHSLTKV